MGYEAVLDVLLLGDDEQILVNRSVELPFQPMAEVLLNGLGERLPFGEKAESLKVDRVVWEDDPQQFWVDCGTVCCPGEDMDALLAKWADWEVITRAPRTVPKWVTLEERPLLSADESGPVGYQNLMPAMRIVAHRDGEENSPLVYTVDADDKVLYADHTFLEPDELRREEWTYPSHGAAIAALMRHLCTHDFYAPL